MAVKCDRNLNVIVVVIVANWQATVRHITETITRTTTPKNAYSRKHMIFPFIVDVDIENQKYGFFHLFHFICFSRCWLTIHADAKYVVCVNVSRCLCHKRGYIDSSLITEMWYASGASIYYIGGYQCGGICDETYMNYTNTHAVCDTHWWDVDTILHTHNNTC